MTDVAGLRPVRVAVWGLGGHAKRRVLPAIARCPSVVLAGVHTRDSTVASDVANQYGCVAFAGSSELLASPDVDAVYLATPTGLHGVHGLEVLSASKHLWCEKSLTPSLDESLALVESSKTRGLALCETFMFRYHPQFELVSRLVLEGAIGPVLSLSGRFTMPLLERPGFRHEKSLGGGALLDLGCYPVALVLALSAGEVRVAWSRLRRKGGLDIDVAGEAVLDLSSGGIATLEWRYGAAYTNELSVIGEQGTLYADKIFSKPDGYVATVERTDRTGSRSVEDVGAADAFERMLTLFARASTDRALRDGLRDEAERQARCMAQLSR